MESYSANLYEAEYLLPVSSTAFIVEPVLIKMPGRNYVLVGDFEGEDDSQIKRVALSFEGVIATRESCSQACDYELANISYDRVISVLQSKWIGNIREKLVDSGNVEQELRHYCFYPDDGPLYEFICSEFRVFEETITDDYLSSRSHKHESAYRRISEMYHSFRTWLDDLSEK